MLLAKIAAILFLCLVIPTLLPAQKIQKITVSQDGSGDFKTVQKAFDAVPINNKGTIWIYVRNGIYREELLLPRGKSFIRLAGEDKFKTILVYDDHTGKVDPNGQVINTRTSASFFMLADNFTANNITFQNDAGFTAGQAVAIEVDGDRAVFNNCRFIGNQDILFTNSDSSRQYYQDCYLEGTTDFIFGSATAWFQRCHVHSKKNSHVTAASTPKDHPFGYVFNECILTGDTSITNASLGRPWQPYASVTYIHCYVGGHIRPEGWSNWNNTENYKTARFAEYGSFGPKGDSAKRLPWIRQLSDAEVKNITLEKVLGKWRPDRLLLINRGLASTEEKRGVIKN